MQKNFHKKIFMTKNFHDKTFYDKTFYDKKFSEQNLYDKIFLQYYFCTYLCKGGYKLKGAHRTRGRYYGALPMCLKNNNVSEALIK